MKSFKILLLATMVIFFTACGGGSSSGGTGAVNLETSQTIAIDKVKAYANDNTQPIPTVQDYIDTGVSGVSDINIDDINAVVSDLIAEDVDTEEEIQALADNLEIVLPDDTTAPVITLNGENPVTLTQGDSYTEAGATATDDRDGNVAVSISGIVNTSTVGTYTRTYTSTDNAGNTATVTRTVNVVLAEDNTPPVITLNGENPVTLTQGDSYTEAGATATDNRDGNVAVSISGIVNTSTVGTYTRTYTSTDNAGNTATVTRTVNVVLAEDNTPPVITLNGENPVTLTQGDSYTEAGATATDDRDGNVAVSISGTVNTSTVGTYTRTYTSTDNAGNTATVTRTVNVVAPPPTSNTQPIANAGIDQNVDTTDTVTLDGTNSFDADGDDLSYHWSFTSRPSGSHATLSNVEAVDPTFTADVDGIYTLQLIVNDGTINSASDTVSINATDPASFKQDYLNAINNARAVQQDCGTEGIKPAVPALTWNDKLYIAAAEHSNDMAKSNTFSHTGSGTQYDITAQENDLGRGSTPTERIENSGYVWQRNGENIAAGTNWDTEAEVIQAWLDSDGHCANLMSPDFEEVGMAMVEDANSDYIHYWTQNFGTPR